MSLSSTRLLACVSSFSVLVLILVLFCEVLAGQSRDEEKAVQSEMSRLDDLVVQASNPFWADGARARAFALLHLRVERVPAAPQYCQRVLGGMHSEYYPLQVVPSPLRLSAIYFLSLRSCIV